MGTLNQYASRIAHLVNQPNNHVLKERIKDMIKTMFANRIRQSVEKHGIDDILKLSYTITLTGTKVKDNVDNSAEFNNFKSENNIATPIRIENDAPFLYVGTTDGLAYQYLNSHTALKFSQSGRVTHSPIGYYLITNGKLLVHLKDDIHVGKTDVAKGVTKDVVITAIFENPDEVLSILNSDDGQDVELPFPNDMLESIIQEILKTEFNIYPKDSDIRMNNSIPSMANKQDNS